MVRDLTPELREIAARVAAAEGVELYWLTYRRGAARGVVTVYIDKPGGVNIEDCARVSRALEDPFDARIDHSYELEVSSPGIDRELHVPAHYRTALGQTVRLKLRRPWKDQSVLTGELQGFSENEVLLDRGRDVAQIPFAQIQWARVVASL